MVSILSIGSSSLLAAGQTDAGLILLDVPSARSAALGQAFSAASNDVSAFIFNPASLSSLETGHTSFLYQNGHFDDSSGQFLVGYPLRQGGVGLSVGYYDGGEIVLFDGNTEREVTAQRDLTMSLGLARDIGNLSFGVTGKFLSSELAETDHATALAADFGLGMPIHSRLRFGASVQNIGSKLKFNDQGDELPRIARAGFSYLLIPSQFKTNLMMDFPYYMNQEELRPSVGLETLVGPMALRIGYKGGSGSQEFFAGTGFLLGQTGLDYAFGMVDELDLNHRISLGYRFGGLDIERNRETGIELDEAPTITFPQLPEER